MFDQDTQGDPIYLFRRWTKLPSNLTATVRVLVGKHIQGIWRFEEFPEA
jgi:hypothetical protein